MNVQSSSWSRVPDSTPTSAPGDARIIVCVQIAFEEYAGARLGSSTSIVPEFPAAALAKGLTDLIGKSWQQYGVNAGLPRLLAVLAEEGIHATVAVSGMLAERYPELVRRIAEEGHEVCGHSWAQDIRLFELSAEEEVENIRRCRDAIEMATGTAPTGWVSPYGQLTSSSLSALARNGYRYTLDAKDDDVPYLIRGDGCELVAIPNPYDINDVQQYAVSGNPPSAFVEVFQRSFDVLYAEGVEMPKMLNAVVHPPLFGRPFGAWALREVIRYAKRHDKVFFATRGEIADLVLNHVHKSSDPAS